MTSYPITSDCFFADSQSLLAAGLLKLRKRFAQEKMTSPRTIFWICSLNLSTNPWLLSLNNRKAEKLVIACWRLSASMHAKNYWRQVVVRLFANDISLILSNW